VGLVPGADDGVSQFHAPLMARFSLCQVTADPVQRAYLIERLGLTSPVADVAVDVQCLLKDLERDQVLRYFRCAAPR
jgi:hypothetical protein